MLINGVKLAALDRIKEDFGGFLDTFEEAIIFGATSRSFLIGMMAEDLLAMGALNLLLGSLEAIFREPKNCVMILTL